MAGSWHGGKGSSPRNLDKKKFDQNWDAIFNKNKDSSKETKDEGKDGNRNRVQDRD